MNINVKINHEVGLGEISGLKWQKKVLKLHWIGNYSHWVHSSDGAHWFSVLILFLKALCMSIVCQTYEDEVIFFFFIEKEHMPGSVFQL